MVFATQVQQLEYVRALLTAQDEEAAALHNASAEEKRAALLAGKFRPPCGCSPDPGPVPCDAAVLSVLSQEPGVPGCPNVTDGD